MLESDGHERITCAAGGNEAIALIGKGKFSLVLLDLMMPDLSGDEVLKVIKSDPDQRDIPVVMISADTNADKVSQCIELGADDFCRSRSIRPSCARGSGRHCADTHFERSKMSIWARSRTRSGIPRTFCGTSCRPRS